MTIQALVFDFGGVLVTWDPYRVFLKYFSNDRQAVDRFLAEIDFSTWNRRMDEGYPFSQSVVDLSARFPQYAHLIHAYDEQWEESVPGEVPGTVELVQKLKRAGYPLYGLSNWNTEKFAIVQHKYPFFDLFDEIVISGDINLAKPDPAIFRYFLQKIRFPARECLLIDDSPANIETAGKMGFTTILFTSPKQLELEFHALNVL